MVFKVDPSLVFSNGAGNRYGVTVHILSCQNRRNFNKILRGRLSFKSPIQHGVFRGRNQSCSPREEPFRPGKKCQQIMESWWTRFHFKCQGCLEKVNYFNLLI